MLRLRPSRGQPERSETVRINEGQAEPVKALQSLSESVRLSQSVRVGQSQSAPIVIDQSRVYAIRISPSQPASVRIILSAGSPSETSQGQSVSQSVMQPVVRPNRVSEVQEGSVRFSQSQPEKRNRPDVQPIEIGTRRATARLRQNQPRSVRVESPSELIRPSRSQNQ